MSILPGVWGVFLECKCVATVQDALRILYRREIELRMKTKFWICVYWEHQLVDGTVAGITLLLIFYSKNCPMDTGHFLKITELPWLATSVMWPSHIVAPSRVFPLIQHVSSCFAVFLYPFLFATWHTGTYLCKWR